MGDNGATGSEVASRQPTAAPRQELVELAASLAPRLAERAAGYDETDAFAAEDLRDLVEAGYTTLTVPADLGGYGAGPLDLIAAQARLAEEAGSLLAEPATLAEMGEVMRDLALPDAAEDLADVVLAAAMRP